MTIKTNFDVPADRCSAKSRVKRKSMRLFFPGGTLFVESSGRAWGNTSGLKVCLEYVLTGKLRDG